MPERTETRAQHEKLVRLQEAMNSFDDKNPIIGLKIIARSLRNVEEWSDERQRAMAMLQGRINAGGTPRVARRKRRTN